MQDFGSRSLDNLLLAFGTAFALIREIDVLLARSQILHNMLKGSASDRGHFTRTRVGGHSAIHPPPRTMMVPSQLYGLHEN
jgi:hypothetical protein